MIKMNNKEGWDHRGYTGEKYHYFINDSALCDTSIMYHPPYFDKNYLPDVNDTEYKDYCIGCIRLLKIKKEHRDLETYFKVDKDV